MAKAVHKVITTDAAIDAAIARRRLGHTVTAASYHPADDVVSIQFADDVQLRIPRRLVQGLQRATPAQLARIEIEGPGTGLLWPALGVAHYVPGLVAGVVGTRQWMAEIGRRGGSRRTRAKAVAARTNGKKGGRPRTR
jgi:hypothetical protein